MDLAPFGVRATAGTLRADQGIVLHHTWTEAGVVAAAAANGGQVLAPVRGALRPERQLP